MARIRSIKPEIHQDEAIGDLSDSAFRLFIGLITQADDHGNLKAGLQLLASQVWPYRPRPLEEVDTLLDELASSGLIRRYTVANKPFVNLPGWAKHQRIDNAGKPQVPGPDFDTSPRVAATRGEKTGQDDPTSAEPTGKADPDDSPRDSASRGGSRLDQGGDQGPRKGEEGSSPRLAAKGTTDPIAQGLDQVAFARSLPSPTPEAVRKACADHPDRDHKRELDSFSHYWTEGPGQRKSLSDVAWAWRRWLGNADAVEPSSPDAPARFAAYDAVMEPAA